MVCSTAKIHRWWFSRVIWWYVTKNLHPTICIWTVLWTFYYEFNLFAKIVISMTKIINATYLCFVIYLIFTFYAKSSVWAIWSSRTLKLLFFVVVFHNIKSLVIFLLLIKSWYVSQQSKFSFKPIRCFWRLFLIFVLFWLFVILLPIIILRLLKTRTVVPHFFDKKRI